MSTYVEHKPCPSCGSRDNLAVYTDHEYCFGCGHIIFYGYHPRRILEVKQTEEKIVSLPEDIQPYIPAIADAWLKQYELTQNELLVNRVVWSEDRNLLVFPYFDDKNYLYGWQGRYFGTNPKHPKWIGHGNFKKTAAIYGKSKEHIVVVEDIISCIKVSRITGCLPLFGSFIDLNKICKINSQWKPNKFFLWLDKDKMKESYLYSNSLNKLGIPSEVITTHEDPKKHSTKQIQEILNIT